MELTPQQQNKLLRWPLPEWLCQRFTNIPTSTKPVRYLTGLETKLLGPDNEKSRFPLKSEADVVPLVPSLFSYCRPPAVLFAVLSKRVNPVYLGVFLSELVYMRFITFVHIFSKLLERLPKAFDTLLSITKKGRIFLVSAPSLYSIKYPIESRSGLSMFQALSHLSVGVRRKTSATFYDALRYFSPSYHFVRPTLTLEEPIVVSVLPVVKTYCGESSKCLSSYIFGCRHNLILSWN